MLRVLVAGTAVLVSSVCAQADNFTVRMENLHNEWVQVKFFSKSRSVSWPGPNLGYDLKDHGVHTYNLSVNPGERICFGAWVHKDSAVGWGEGIKGNAGCENCCWVTSNGGFSDVVVLSIESRGGRLVPVYHAQSHKPDPHRPPKPAIVDAKPVIVD
jgi:hypothetical protein